MELGVKVNVFPSLAGENNEGGDQIKFEKGLSEDVSKISFVTDFLLPEASSVEIVPLGSRISQVKGGMCRA